MKHDLDFVPDAKLMFTRYSDQPGQLTFLSQPKESSSLGNIYLPNTKQEDDQRCRSVLNHD